MIRPTLRILALVASSPLIVGCVTRAPSIAHVHVGHALTAVHVTPEQRGYFIGAGLRAQQARDALRAARAATDARVASRAVAQGVAAVGDDENFGLRHSLAMAINHISFAATSPDASLNLQDWAPVFAQQAQRVLERCELLVLLGTDYAAARDAQESAVLLEEILKLAEANIEGDDSNGDGIRGALPAEFGMQQLEMEVQAMLARERPAYRPVDQWYLFNLVLLPNGRWVYDKFSRGGQIAGYK